MVSSVCFILAAAWASAGADRVDRKAITEAAVKMSAEQGAVAASSLTSEVEDALMAAAVARFRAVRLRNSTGIEAWLDDTFESVKKTGPADPAAAMATLQAFFDKLKNIPGTDPIWPKLRAKMKAYIRADPDGDEFISMVENKQWDLYLDKACNLPAGAPLEKENGKSTHPWPIDAYFCGHHGIDWSGVPWNGKPIVDLCNAKVGDASSVNVCGKFTDKEIVLGMNVDVNVDPRNTNIITLDCLMDTMDGDIHYCHKCAGRCIGW